MKKPTVTVVASPPADRTITLTMNEDVARTLFVLVGKVSGDNLHSRRVHASTIYYALQGQGVKPIDRHLYDGGFSFEDEPVDA